MDLSDIDFGKITTEAHAMVSADNSTSVAPPAPVAPAPVPAAPQAAPVTQPDPTAAVVAPPISGQPAIADERFDVDFGNGKVEKLSRAEIAQKLIEAERSGLRQADYTKKTQEAAKLREEALEVHRQLQAQAQALQQREALYADPNAMLAEAQRRVQASQPIDPTQPMTIAQGLELVKAVKSEFNSLQEARKAEIESARLSAHQIVEDRLAVADYAEKINGTLNKVYTDHPILKELPEMEAILRYRVSQLNPETIDETLTAFQRVAKELAAPYDRVVQTTMATQAAERAKLVSQGIEPPGGVAPQITPPDFKAKEGRDLDWNKLKEYAKQL